MFYLYVKTHKKTNLKYLGYTRNDPITYAGSGVYWKSHLAKHGYHYNTEIIAECQDKNELKEKGLYYSRLWNVVESDEWANLKEEAGDGGDPGPEGRKKISEARKGQTPWNKGIAMWNDEQRAEISRRSLERDWKPNPEVIKRTAEINRGAKRSEETKAKLKAARAARDDSKIYTEDVRKKMSESAKKRGYQGNGFQPGAAPHNAKEVTIEDTETGEVTTARSLKKWAEERGFNPGSVWAAMNRKGSWKQYRKLEQ